ncbi:MAG TPA: terminase family protein [Sphingomicrobium sp.]
MGKTVGPRLRGDDARVRALLAKAAVWCGNDVRRWRHFLRGLPPPVLRALYEWWAWQAHLGQLPEHDQWTVWLMMAGRGFGKTLAGAKWVHEVVRPHPSAASRLPPSPAGEGIRIALVGAAREDAVRVMVEGPSGLLATAPSGEPVEWCATRGALRFAGGAEAFVYSAGAPEGLRGPEHHFAWCDELAKWHPKRADAAWDNLMMGLRLGSRPQCVVTTTPRPVPLLKRVRAVAGFTETGGTSRDNVHLPDAFLEWAVATYGGTRVGRQELDGELLADVEGTLFPRALLERSRTDPHTGPLPLAGEEGFVRIVVGVDPPASVAGTCGIVVGGVDAAGMLFVLADASAPGASPERWAKAVAATALGWGADRVVAEQNQGGDMVAEVLRSADAALPLRLVSASRGKAARAEPVAALFEAGRARLAGRFPELEDELAGLQVGGGYAGPGPSPDRADACVWALTALASRSAPPRVSVL